MDRRQFVLSSAAATAAGLLRVDLTRHAAPINPIGVQLFSVPKLLERDFRAGIAMLSQMGYREIEMYGPFSFSAPEAIKGWAAVTPQLGFSGSGFFGLTASQVRAILDGHVVLSRGLATRGRFPAIDPLASLSRLATKLSTPQHLAAAARLRGHLAVYEEKRDLVLLGAYKRGNDPALDRALSAIDAIEEFLRQPQHERADPAATLARLDALGR